MSIPAIKFKSAVFVTSGALLLMGLCFYNGYPLYGGDTHSYVYGGFNHVFGNDRPPFYGEFIRISSGWQSLWFTVFVQCLMISWLLLDLTRLLSGKNDCYGLFIVSVGLTSALTCAPWICATLMPDAFGSALLLGIMLYFFAGATRRRKIAYLALIFSCIAVHNSNFLIVAAVASIILVYALNKRKMALIKKCVALNCLSIAFYFLMCVLNNINGNGFIFSPASRVFTMAKLASSGILDKYLEDKCPKKHLRLCSCMGQLPEYPWNFMWPAPENPLSKIGVWDSSTKEFDSVLKDVFTTPKYVSLYAKKSCVSTFRQLFEVQLMTPFNFSKEMWQKEQLRKYFDDEYKEFSVSRQNTDGLDAGNFNLLYDVVFLLTSVLVFLYYRQNRLAQRIYGFLILFLLANSFVTATFSTVYYRFEARMWWIITAVNIILILHHWMKRQEETDLGAG